MDLKKYTEANRAAWNEVMPIHQKSRRIDLKKKFKESRYSTLDKLITGKLLDYGLKGKKAAQVCCNNGRETISMVNIGAASADGFDISDEAIKEARELAEIAGTNCSFIRTDIYEIPEDYHGRYDFVLVTIGALPWMPDLEGFFAMSARLLAPDGILMVYEEHPFVYMLANDRDKEYEPDNPLKLISSYFRTEPWVDNDGIDYVGGTNYKAKTTYNFMLKISDILNSAIKCGLTIREFNEYPHDTSDEFARIEEYKLLPLSCLLVAQKV